MRYIGIDLAWGEKNTSAAVVLQGNAAAGDAAGDAAGGASLMAVADALTDDADILAWVDGHDDDGSGGLLVAVDAPLIVPNETGRRPCEAVLSACLARVQAGPHPSNRARLAAPDGTVRGERIAHALAARGLPQTPHLETLSPGQRPLRACLEVFPHPAHVALFGLAKTLKYKAKPGRDSAARLAEFARYADLLQSLTSADPPLLLGGANDAPGRALLERADLATLGAGALKRHEDALDALTCAYVALYHHRWAGTERSTVVGDLSTGYIVTPADAAMQACFAARQS